MEPQVQGWWRRCGVSKPGGGILGISNNPGPKDIPVFAEGQATFTVCNRSSCEATLFWLFRSLHYARIYYHLSLLQWFDTQTQARTPRIDRYA